MHSIDNTVEKLEKYSAPRALIELARAGFVVHDLAYIWQKPKIFYDLVRDYPNNMPSESCLVPLWEVNGDKIIALIDDGTERVIEYYYEDSANEFKVIGLGIQAAIRESLKWLYIEAEYSESQILSLAQNLDVATPEAFIDELKKST